MNGAPPSLGQAVYPLLKSSGSASDNNESRLKFGCRVSEVGVLKWVFFFLSSISRPNLEC